MKANPEFTFHQPPGSPGQVLQNFRQTYTLEEAQAELWRYLQPGLAVRLLEGIIASSRSLAFCACLEYLLEAIYQLPEPTAGDRPISSAVQALRQGMPHDWVLLICPPE